MNPAHQSAVAHLKERMTAHPRAVLVAVEIEHLKQLDSLITELEADGKRLISFVEDLATHDLESPNCSRACLHNAVEKAQKLDAAMKGAV